MKLTTLSWIFLSLICCSLFSCKKKEITPPVLNTSFEYIKYGLRFTASFNNLANDEIRESGFVWGTSNTPTKNNGFSYKTETPKTNFSYDVFSGLKEKTTYFLRSYFIDKNNVIQYSPTTSFEGKTSTGIFIQINYQNYTWGDQVEIKVNAEQSPDLSQATIYLNDSIKVTPSKIDNKSLFFIIPNDLKNYRNGVSLEMYGQRGSSADLYLSQPKIDKQLMISGKVNETLKINGDFFNPVIKNNVVMIGNTKVEVLNATKTQLEVKLIDAEFAYSGELSIQTGNELKVKSETTSKVYKYITQLTNFPGEERINGTVVQMNGKVYCGLGYRALGLNDFWEYDPTNNQWRRMADAPNNLNGGNKTFVIQNKLYVIQDMHDPNAGNIGYKFDPATNSWSRIEDYFDYKTQEFSVFSSNKYGYMICGSYDTGGGYIESLKLVRRYNPSTNQWQSLPDFPGTKRRGQKVLKVGNKVIVFGGSTVSPRGPASFPSDCWSFDLNTEKWTQINTVPSYVVPAISFDFELNGKGYVGGGSSYDNKTSSELYEYDPATDHFTKKDNIFDNIWLYAHAVGINNKAYILFGTTQLGPDRILTNQMFQFTP